MKIVTILSLLGIVATCSFSSFSSLKIEHDANVKKTIVKKSIDFSSLKGSRTLRLLNWEDYIHLYDPDNGYYEKDLVEQFEDYVLEEYGEKIEVVYSTTDTNETMLNELATGKAHYDLICPSDYGIQKLMANDQLVKIGPLMEEYGLTNYSHYASPKLISYLQGIAATNKVTNEIEYVSDFAVGYMWGTLGIIFNPEYDLYNNRPGNPVSPEQMIEDMADWSSLWDEKYYGGISVKDSVRDAYVIALAEVPEVREQLEALLDEYHKGNLSADEYNKQISILLNQSDEATTKKVLEKLKELKKNIFGLEVDSGKQDIVTGYIGINTAWSGDAVYAMDLADEYNAEHYPDREYGLCYSVPNTGANIWFDGWCMPKDDTRSEVQEVLALLFLDFISDPNNAAQNTNYIGYTSFIGGDTMLDLVRDWYDIRTDLIYNYNEENDEWYSLYYLSEGTYTEVWYEDVHYENDNDPSMNDKSLYYAVEDDNGEYVYDEENGILNKYNGAEHNGLSRYNLFPYVDDNGDAYTYNNHLLMDESWEEVDLSYFFNGTLDEYEDNVSTKFYSDCYLPFTNSDGTKNTAVGRQFFCQFPDEETMTRCVIMADFGENNKFVVRMWEDFKANDIEPWMIVLFVGEAGLIIAGVLYVIISKKMNKRLRKQRRQQQLEE